MQFHDVLHGFREVRGARTSSLESKLLQKLKAMREDVLYTVSLDLRKVYDALDRYRFMEILVGYGVSLRTTSILRYY